MKNPIVNLCICGVLKGKIFWKIQQSIAKEEYRSKWCPVDVFMYIILAFIFVHFLNYQAKVVQDTKITKGFI